jgi:Sap-like sulfolipid-1-addressing protein
LIEIIPLAFLSALYPTLLAVVVLVLQRPDPRRLLGAYLAGAMLTSMVVGYAIVSALKAGSVVGGGDHTVGPGAHLAGGAIALLLVWFLASDWGRERRERLKERREARQAKRERTPWSERVIQRGSVRLTFLVGMALNLPGAMYLVALTNVAAADLGTAETLGVLLVYNLIMFQWAELPLIGYAIAPERTQTLVTAMNHWLRAHAREVAIVICSIAAAYMITTGIAGLT